MISWVPPQNNKTLATLERHPKSLHKIEFKDSGLISLAEGISRSSFGLQHGYCLLLTAPIRVYSEKKQKVEKKSECQFGEEESKFKAAPEEDAEAEPVIRQRNLKLCTKARGLCLQGQ